MITVPLLGVDITEGEVIWQASPSQEIRLLGYHLWAADEAQNSQMILLLNTSGGELLAIAAGVEGGIPVNFPDAIPAGRQIMAVLSEPPQLAPVLMHGLLWGEEVRVENGSS